MRAFAFVGLIGIAVGSAQAAVLFDQGPTTGTYSGAWMNYTASQNFADQFVLANDSTVTRYVYYTSFYPASFGTFTVKLLADSATAPGVDPGVVIGTQTVIQSGFSLVGSFSGNDIYRVNLDLTTPWALTGGVRYWAGASGDGFEAAQVSLNPGPGDNKMAQFSGSTFVNNATVGDQQFGLEGDIDEPPPGVEITCADWTSEVGIWGPATAPCGDLASTTMVPVYESASFFDVFTDFIYEAELVATRPFQPTAANTVFLRGDPTPRGQNQVWDSGYAFSFTTATTGRKYSIFRYSNGRPIVVQAWVAAVPPAVINGSGVANTLKVEANGGSLTFYLNGTPVKTITGQTLLSGQVGVGMVRSMATGPTLKDTLVINAATVTPGGGTRPTKGVSAAQERANEAANQAALSTRPDPLFSDTGKKW